MLNSVVKKRFLTTMLFMVLTRKPTEGFTEFHLSCKPSCDMVERAQMC